MKRTILLLLLLAAVLIVPSVRAADCLFSDVCPRDYFYAPVSVLAADGAISGYADGSFRPYNSVTRGQLAKIVTTAHQMSRPAEVQHFSDVAPDNPFYAAVEAAYAAGLISGYADGTFRPFESVTRGQAAKIAYNSLPEPPSATGTATRQPTLTRIPTRTNPPTRTPIPSYTPRPTKTATTTRTATATATLTPTPTATPYVLYFLPIGDSKTVGASDESGGRGYPATLAELLTRRTGVTWQERPRIAQGGTGVSAMLERLRADLPLQAADPAPTYILINLGINDLKNWPNVDPATWQADYSAMLDLLHEKWPAARIGLMRVGARDVGSANTALLDDSLIPTLLVGRDYVFLGPDERVFLAGPDDYLTFTVEGTHPNFLGYAATAAAWLATLP